LSKKMKSGVLVERLDRWYADLDHWMHVWRKRNTVFHRRLRGVERQIRLLMQLANEYLSEVETGEPACTTKQQTAAAHHELLARCLSYQCNEEKDEEAIHEFRTAIALAPTILEYWLSYVRHLIGRNLLSSALKEINTLDLRHLESEAEEGAILVANWALAYPEIGFGIRADLLKYCIARLSKEKRALLVMGSAFPRDANGKWKYGEKIRILACEMYGSLSLDELCKREGIDKATYYRWRARLLGPEKGRKRGHER
jgi:hypothetical protein